MAPIVEIRAGGGKHFHLSASPPTKSRQLRAAGYNPCGYYNGNGELRQTLDMLRDGFFAPEERERYKPVFDNLTANGDHYLLLADYGDYIACQEQVGALYGDPAAWVQKSILNVAGMGQFSSDRTIGQYAKTIWNVEAVPRPLG